MIVPALLTSNKEELVKMINMCGEFTDFVQLDFMDGEFVPSKSVLADDLKGLKPCVPAEAHIMVNKPLDWLGVFADMGILRVIYHFEIKGDHITVINGIRGKGIKVGLAINPATPINDFNHLVDKVDSILFMSVNPGFYGAPFIPQVLDKIKAFKAVYPEKIAGIDGGVKLDNLRQVMASGVDYVCVGSAILKAPNPSRAYESFLEVWNNE